jgi:hypothetical protein
LRSGKRFALLKTQLAMCRRTSNPADAGLGVSPIGVTFDMIGCRSNPDDFWIVSTGVSGLLNRFRFGYFYFLHDEKSLITNSPQR